MPFFKEAKDEEPPNSCTINEIPSISDFNSQMLHAKDVEVPNSHVVIEVGLDEIPSILGFDSVLLHLPVMKVSPFHVICDMYGVLIATHLDRGFFIVILCPRLKEFLEKCFVQF